MSGKIYTQEDVLAEVKRQNYKLIWLENPYGEMLKNPNAPSIKPMEQVKRIFELLNSDLYPNGRYLVKAKTSTKDRSMPGIMAVVKGRESEIVPAEAPKLYKLSENEVKIDVASYLETYATNAKLQAENEMLKTQRASQSARITFLEEQLEELRGENRDMAEGQKPTGFDLSQLAPFVPLFSELIKPKAPAEDPEKLALQKGFKQMAENQRLMIIEVEKLRKAGNAGEEEEEEEITFDSIEDLLDYIGKTHGPEALAKYKLDNNLS